jgi:glycosyltransferase involved in cell wall biosynthesis
MISFIVPAYNEELELPRSLAAIRAAAEDGNEKYEIIVVDDGSTDATADIARQSGVRLVQIQRRQIAAARNAGAQIARGQILFFVDADTRIFSSHVMDAIVALNAGYSGGSARVIADGVIPLWARLCVRVFCTVYFANNLGAGAFLFATRKNFDAIGGFDEELFIGEEVYFSLALRKLGRFKILRAPILTSGRKLRMYSAGHILSRTFYIMIRGRRAARSRDQLDLWYEGRREIPSAMLKTTADYADNTDTEIV